MLFVTFKVDFVGLDSKKQLQQVAKMVRHTR